MKTEMKTKIEKLQELTDMLWQIRAAETGLEVINQVNDAFMEKFGTKPTPKTIEKQEQKISKLKNKYNRLAIDLVAFNFTDV